MEIKKISIFFISIFGILVFWGGNKIFKESNQSPYSTDNLFTYLMPKLKLYTPKFSLFDRTFVFHHKKSAVKSNSNKLAAKTNIPIKANPAVIPPKNPAKTQPFPPDNEATIEPDSSSNQIGDSHSDNKKNEESDFENNNIISSNPNSNSNPNSVKERKSISNQVNDWKQKILNTPTREMMNQFVYAYEMEDISKEVYFKVMEELVKDQNPDILDLTLFGLSKNQSYDNLSFLLMHKEDFTALSSSMYRLVLAMYEKPSMLKLFSKVLNSTEPSVVLGVMPLISKVGRQFSEWSSDLSSHSEDHRDQRGPATRKPKGDIIQIIKTLEFLRESQDHQIALAAQETLKDINYSPSETNVSLVE